MKTDYRTWWRGAREVCEIMDGVLWTDYNANNFRLSSEMEGGCKCAQCDCIFEQLWAIREGLAE